MNVPDKQSHLATEGRTPTGMQIFRWPFLVAILALLVATGKWPYDFYVLLRFFVCGVTIYGAVQAYARQQFGWVWTLIAIALLFNPLFPVHLRRQTWEVLDVVTACIIGLFQYQLFHRRPES